MQTCLISKEGDHDPPLHYMRVDGFGLLLDLSNMRNSAVDPGSLTDPTITRVEWGPVIINGEARERGLIRRQDGTVQTFFEKHLLNAYLDAFAEKKAQLLADHAVAVAAQKDGERRALDAAIEVEKRAWSEALAAGTAEAFTKYLESFQRHGDEARARLSALQQESSLG